MARITIEITQAKPKRHTWPSLKSLRFCMGEILVTRGKTTCTTSGTVLAQCYAKNLQNAGSFSRATKATKTSTEDPFLDK